MKRTAWIHTVVTPAEKARVVAAAAKARLTISAWVRYTLMDAVVKEERPK